MIEHPDEQLAKYVEAGADSITFHYEALQESVQHTINLIHSLHKKVGISIKPDTDVSVLLPYLSQLDLILIMSVEPGKGGQKFLASALEKIKLLVKLRKEFEYQYLIEVDGGINLDTAKAVKAAGADVIVVGSFIFNHQDRASLIMELEND
jgi:ribulose-phosphate 3-epimerase